MSQIAPVFKREFLGYFRSPVAYVFLIVFLVASVGLAFFIGGFFRGNQASLESFFVFHPWLYLFLIPAVSMRLWAEERRQGTLELLLTLPIPLWGSVVGKFLAAWAFTGIALAADGRGAHISPAAICWSFHPIGKRNPGARCRSSGRRPLR